MSVVASCGGCGEWMVLVSIIDVMVVVETEEQVELQTFKFDLSSFLGIT